MMEHAVRSVFIGYPPDYSGWKFINLATGREFISNSAIFIEDVFPGRLRADAKQTNYSISHDLFNDSKTDVVYPNPVPTPTVPVASTPNTPSSSPSPIIRNLPPAHDDDLDDLPPEQAAQPAQPLPPPAPRLSREERNLQSNFEKHPGPNLGRGERRSRAEITYAEPADHEFVYSAEKNR